MKNKIQFNIQIGSREIDSVTGMPYPYSNMIYQTALVNEELPFDQQIEGMKQMVEIVMNNLRREHEKKQYT